MSSPARSTAMVSGSRMYEASERYHLGPDHSSCRRSTIQSRPSEQWVEKFARYYTPAVMALALLVLIAPPLLFGADWSSSLYRASVTRHRLSLCIGYLDARDHRCRPNFRSPERCPG